MEDLGTLSGGDWSEAFGVNDYGDYGRLGSRR